MDDSSFLVEIVLKAVDQASGPIRNLNRAVDDLKAKGRAQQATGDLSSGLDDVGRSARQAEGDVRSHREETERAADAHDRHATAAGRSSKALDDHGSSADAARGKVKAVADEEESLEKAHARVEKAAAKLAETQDKLNDSYQGGTKSADDYVNGLQRIENGYERLSRSLKIGDELGESMHRSALQVKADYASVRGELDATARSSSQRLRDIESESQRNAALSRSLSSLRDSYRDLSANSSKFSASDQARAFQQISQEAASLTRQLKQGSDAWREMSRIADESRRASRSAGVSDDASRLVASYREFDQLARSGQVTASAAKDSYKDFASSFDRVRDSIDKGSESWRQYGRLIDDATKKAANAKTVVTGGGLASGVLGNLGSAAQGGGLSDVDRALQNLSAHADNFGIKIVSLSAQLRGFALAAGVGLFQQLDTAIVGVVGSLFSVGAAATQAAATLGGAFVAGIAQAIPTLSIFAAALNRLKVVMQAVSAAQNVQQQQGTNVAQQQISQLSGTNSVITAQEQLANSYTAVKNAQEQVISSQDQLTIARRDAARQIQDLMLAEQQAELQAKGANITLQQAQQNLQQVIQTGGTGTALSSAQLQVQQAQLGQRQANVQLPRARFDANQARQQGVSGAPSVVAAQHSLDQARQSLVQAQQQIGDSTRALELAKDQAAQATSAIATAQHQLAYFLGQLSPTEEKLFEALKKLADYFRDPNSPFNKIADQLLAPFVGGLGRITTLLNDKSFLKPFDDLAKSIGGGITEILNSLTGKQGAGFLDEMATNASKNVPIIASSISQIITIFEQIARAASPILHVFIEDFNKFVTAAATKLSSGSGLSELTSFFQTGAGYVHDFVNWFGAFIRLLGALGGDAAPVGGDLVQGWTKQLNDLAGWVSTHGDQVRNFFTEAGRALNILAGILAQVGLGMIKLMSDGGLQALGTLLQQVVIPVLVDAGKVLGVFTTGILDLLNAIPGLHTFVDLFGGFAVAAIAIGKLYGPLRSFIGLIVALKEGGVAFAAYQTAGAGLLESLTAARDVTASRLAAERGIIVAIQAQTDALTAQSAVRDTILADATATDVASAGGAGGAASGATGAVEGAAGAGGVAAAIRAGATRLGLVGLAAGTAGLAFNALDPSNPGKRGQGLSSLLGPIGGDVSRGNTIGAGFSDVGELLTGHVGDAFHNTRPLNAQATTTALTALKNGLQGISSPAQLSARQVDSLYTRTQQILRMPDITATQRKGLNELSRLLADQMNPAVKRFGDQWTSTFSGINSTTGDVMKQVKGQLKTDIANISANLGTGTKEGSQALVSTIYGAWLTVLNNTSAAVRGTETAIKQISGMLNQALKAMGEAPLSTSLIGNLSKTDPGVITGLLTGTLSAGGVASPHAEGGWHSARSGGNVIRVGEAGADEVTLTTDPRHGPRQASLLSQYLQRAPHMATGGFVPGPGTNFSYGEEPRIVAALTRLADALGVTVYGISGYRTPQHSASVGGFTNDPHTRGQAADIGVNSALRASAGQLTNSVLAKYGLWRPFDMSGEDPNEINHVQLLPSVGGPAVGGVRAPRAGRGAGSAISQAAAGVAAKVAQLIAPHISAKGAIGSIAQGGVNAATAAANSLLASVGGALTAPSNFGANLKLKGPIEHQVEQFMSAAGFNKIAIAGMLGNAVQESSLNPNTPGGGFWQQISNFGSGTGGSLLHQMQVMLPQIEHLKAAMNSARSAGDAAVIFEQGFEKAGIPALANRIAGAEAAFSAGYAGGGRIGNAPWGGRPVALIGHEGERISNPSQWGEVARMAGTTPSGLDAHLGYTSTPKQSFADGGNVVGARYSAGAPNLSGIDWSSIGAIGTVLQYIQIAFTNLSDIGIKSKDFSQKFIPTVDKLLTQDTGVFDRLNTAFTVIQNMLNAALVIGGKAAGTGLGAASRTGYLANLAPAFSVRGNTVVQTQSPTSQSDESIQALSEQRRYLTGERGAVNTVLSSVSQRLKQVRGLAKNDPSKYKGELQSLTSEYNNLISRIEALTGQISQNVSDTFSAEQQRVQNILTNVSNTYDTQQSQIQGRQSVAQARGNFGQSSTFDTQLAASATREISALQPALKEAQKIKDPNLVAQIKQQIASLRSTAAEAAIQAISDAQQAIDQAAQTTQAGLQSQQSVAQAYGRLTQLPGIDQAIANAATNQIAKLQPLLEEAQKGHDTGLTQQITQEIDQLQSTVAQATSQMITDSISAIQQQAQTDQASVQATQSIAQTLQGQASTPGQFAAAGALSLSALNFNQSSLQGQLGQYNSLLGQAVSTGNTGAVATITQTIDQLTAELASNTAAIQDNTAQVVQQTTQFIQARGSFQTGIYGGLASIVSTIGQTTGSTDVGTLSALTGASNRSLVGTNSALLGQLSQLGGGASGIASALSGITDPAQFVSAFGGLNISGAESGQDSTWITTFEGIITALETNTGQIATNNQQLATLNGQLTQPQTWASMTWTAFRTAVFSGMGNLLPSYQGVLAGTSSAPNVPIFSPVGSSGVSPTIGNLNITTPTEQFDPQVVGEQMFHHLSTAP